MFEHELCKIVLWIVVSQFSGQVRCTTCLGSCSWCSSYLLSLARKQQSYCATSIYVQR